MRSGSKRHCSCLLLSPRFNGVLRKRFGIRQCSRLLNVITALVVVLLLYLVSRQFLSRPPLLRAPPVFSAENQTGKLYYADRIVDDWRHSSILYEAAHQTFAGLRLNKVASSGVYISPEERQHVAEFLASKGEPVNDTMPHHHELLSRLIAGDSLQSHNEMNSVVEQFFTFDQKPQVFMKRFCDVFISLLRIPNLPALVVGLSTFTTFEFALRCLHEREEELQALPRKFVLVTTDADFSSSYSFFSPEIKGNLENPHVNVSYLIQHPFLSHWFTTDMDVRHPKVSSLPVGVYNFYIRGRGLFVPTASAYGLDLGLTEAMLSGLNLTALFPHVGHSVTLWKRHVVWLEDALELFTDQLVDPPVEWVPLSALPARVTRVMVVLMPLEPGKRANRPSLTSEVLVFRESGDGVTEASQSVALLPFTAALYHRWMQVGFGSPSRDPRVLSAFTLHAARGSVFEYMNNHPEFALVTPKENVRVRKKRFMEIAKNMMFVMSPPGYGYECYRTWESLFLGAIPILVEPKSSFFDVYHTYRDDTYKRIAAYGGEIDPSALLDVYKDLPVVVVKDVSEITAESLERWRSEIYAKLQRGEYQLERLFSQTWLDEIHGVASGDPL